MQRFWGFLAGSIVCSLPVATHAGEAPAPFREELLLGFGGSTGTWLQVDQGDWQAFHALTPELVEPGDFNGNGQADLAVDFGAGGGLWVRIDGATWVSLSGASPEAMATGDLDFNGLDDLVVDFGGLGTWVRYNGTTWVSLVGLDPGAMTVGDLDEDLRDDIVLAFGSGLGTWVRYNDTDWVQIHSGQPQRLARLQACGTGAVIADFGAPFGLWAYCQDYFGQPGWLELVSATSEGFLAAQLLELGGFDEEDEEELVVDFGPSGLWVFLPAFGWEQLSAADPASLGAGNLDGIAGEELIASFEGFGTWTFYNAEFWTQHHALAAPLIEAGDVNRPALTCFELLAEGWIVRGDDCLTAALAVNSDDELTRMGKALSTVARGYEEQVAGPAPGPTDSLKEMLDAIGVGPASRSLFNFTAAPPETLATDTPTGGDVQAFLRNVPLADLDEALELLEPLDTPFETALTNAQLPELGATSFDVDYADAKLLEAALAGWKAVWLTLPVSHDLDVDIDELSLLDPLRLQEDVLDFYPNLLHLHASGELDLQEASLSYVRAIEAYFAASLYIRENDDGNQTDDLFVIEDDPVELEEEEMFRQRLGEIICSLGGVPLIGLDSSGSPVCDKKGDPSIGGKILDLSAFFSQADHIRDHLPPFAYDPQCGTNYVEVSRIDRDSPFPDPTFGGVAPTITQEQLLDQLCIPARLSAYGQQTIFGKPNDGAFGFVFATNECDLGGSVEVTDIDLEVGGAFGLASKFKLPITLCPADGLYLFVEFSPPSEGEYFDTLIFETSAGQVTFPLHGCTSFGDCDGFPGR